MNQKTLTTLIMFGLVISAAAKAESNLPNGGLNNPEFSEAAQIVSEMMNAGLLIQDKNGDIKVDRSFKEQLLRSGRIDATLAGDTSICH